MYNTYKTPLYARCKFHSRVSYTNFTIPGSWRAGCRWQLLPFLLYVSPPLSLQRSLPRIQAVLNREKWIFWSERISTSNPFLLRHCLLSPWWFMGGRVSSVLREKQYLLDAWLAYSRTSLRIEIAGGSVTMLKTSLIPLFPRRGGEEIYWELFLGRRVLDELFEWKHCGKEILCNFDRFFDYIYIFLDCRNRNRFLREM